MEAKSIAVRELREDDLAEVERIHAARTGGEGLGPWARVFPAFFRGDRAAARLGLVAESGGQRIGFLLGEVRAYEFGCEPCAWIDALEVEPESERVGVATRLLEEACRRFRALGVRRVRTLVNKHAVPLMSFFRANGFAGGSFVELERDADPSPPAGTPAKPKEPR